MMQFRQLGWFGAAAAVAAGFMLSPAPAQEPGSRLTREFVQAAGESDTFEIMEAYSALAQSTDPHLLAFARQMIRDHGETSRALRQATALAGLAPPPAAVGASQAPLLAALQSQRGADFDHAYWQHQLFAHRAALVVEQNYAENGDTAAIRQAASAAIPMIRQHLDMAQRMANGAN